MPTAAPPLLQLLCEIAEAQRKALAGVLPEFQSRSSRNTGKSAALRQYLSRALGWISTLARLGHVVHFQAYAAAHRSLIEITTDCLLLHQDQSPGEYLAGMLEAWERSAQFKVGTCYLEYYRTQHTDIPPDLNPLNN